MTKKIPYAVFILILVVSFSLMLSVSVKESATMDELAHIPAGYGYLRYLDYRLNPEHPPLVKILSAIPLFFIRSSFPLTHSSWDKDINGQWVVGNQFLYHSGNDADRLIFWGRMGPIILTLLLIVLIFIWAKELLGEKWALLPTFLFAFSPTVLAHGHYVTTDIGAAFGVVLATYFFIKFLLKPTGRYLVFAGLTFGLAQLMKFTVAFLVPYFLILTLVWIIRSKYRLTKSISCFLSLVTIFLIGLFLIYLVYLIFTLNYPISKQVADTEFLLSSFKHRWLAELNIKMAGNKFSRPLAQYLLGLLMVFQRSAHGNTAYFLGKISSAGWWYYFPVVFLLKEPIPSLILILVAFLFGFWKIIKQFKIKNWKLKIFWNYLGTHFPEFSMLIFVIFYWLYSMQSSLNIGLRHILPTMPFIYILTTSGLKNWVNSRSFAWYSARFASIFKLGLIAIFLFWYLWETVGAYPFYLSYFNQFGGGTAYGYRYVTDSNYDWGQDLKRLAKWVNDNDIKKIAVDYFGGGDTRYYLGDKVEVWQSARGNPKDIGIEWLAVSINTLQGVLAKPVANFQRNPEDEYRWLQEIRNPYQPDYRAGTSIFIYHLE